MSDATDLEKRGGPSSWQPPELIQTAPIFVWPPQPKGLLKALFGFPGYLWPWNVLYSATALLTWLFLTPSFARMDRLAVGWIAIILLRNLALIVLVASVWHLRLYVQRAQGTRYKYNGRWLSTSSSHFLFHNQVLDNVFWTIVSAVPIWTAYEVLTLWAQASGTIRLVSWQAHPGYCLLLMLLIPLIHEIHFYILHRLLHWAPLYRLVHSLHHKNVNPGPWSGLAMHPIEHMLYLSGVFLLWIIPSHPLHVLFYLQWVVFLPSQGHCGFGRVVLGKETTLNTDNYFHYLHHKYFEVNYGDQLIPLDDWFGTFHDGSDKAQETMNRRVLQRSISKAARN
jgi:sterol desaturase/sphingolipid hydroxylase (fatty acid hydroxylase superfamily)